MKTRLAIAFFFGLLAAGCSDDDEQLFEKSADARAQEAIAQLRADLMAPADGWMVRYRPEESSGMYYVLLNFIDDERVVIQSDLGAEGGRYFKDTVTYRVDNSLGLELIIETFSMFSYLFQQDFATFGAEYEFNYVNATPDNALVFRSKTDLTDPPDLILFEPATAGAEDLLGVSIAEQLSLMATDLNKVFPSLLLTYEDRDLLLYMSIDDVRRTVTFNAASLKSTPGTTQNIAATSPYYLQGDALVFETPLQRNILGNAVSLESIRLLDAAAGELGTCATPIPSHSYTGLTSDGEPVILASTLRDASGAGFAQLSDFYFAPLQYIFEDGFSVTSRIGQDIPGALEMHLYYGYNLGGGDVLNGIGFVIENPDGTFSFALREFTPTLIDNRVVFDFEPNISIFGSPTDPTNLENINIYLDALTDGDQTYVFRLNTGLYEFHNPCTRWSFVFIDAS